MKDAYNALEFALVQAQIKPYARGERARHQIDHLLMIEDKDALTHELFVLDEMSSLLFRYGNLPLSFSTDLTPYLELAKKGGTLQPADFDHIAEDILT